jgi:inner membrane protein
MPSPIAHLSAGYAIYRLYKHKLPGNAYRLKKVPYQLLLIAVLSLLPDLDFLFGLIYGDVEKFHNNISHSLFFGLLVALIVSTLAYWKNRSNFWGWFIVSMLSYDMHVILDIFTGERGVMLLWPLVQDRFSSPVKLFVGVQWGLGLFTIWHVWTILSETLFLIIIFVLLNFFEKKVLLRPEQEISPKNPGVG